MILPLFLLFVEINAIFDVRKNRIKAAIVRGSGQTIAFPMDELYDTQSSKELDFLSSSGILRYPNFNPVITIRLDQEFVFADMVMQLTENRFAALYNSVTLMIYYIEGNSQNHPPMPLKFILAGQPKEARCDDMSFDSENNVLVVICFIPNVQHEIMMFALDISSQNITSYSYKFEDPTIGENKLHIEMLSSIKENVDQIGTTSFIIYDVNGLKNNHTNILYGIISPPSDSDFIEIELTIPVIFSQVEGIYSIDNFVAFSGIVSSKESNLTSRVLVKCYLPIDSLKCEENPLFISYNNIYLGISQRKQILSIEKGNSISTISKAFIYNLLDLKSGSKFISSSYFNIDDEVSSWIETDGYLLNFEGNQLGLILRFYKPDYTYYLTHINYAVQSLSNRLETNGFWASFQEHAVLLGRYIGIIGGNSLRIYNSAATFLELSSLRDISGILTLSANSPTDLKKIYLNFTILPSLFSLLELPNIGPIKLNKVSTFNFSIPRNSITGNDLRYNFEFSDLKGIEREQITATMRNYFNIEIEIVGKAKAKMSTFEGSVAFIQTYDGYLIALECLFTPPTLIKCEERTSWEIGEEMEIFSNVTFYQEVYRHYLFLGMNTRTQEYCIFDVEFGVNIEMLQYNIEGSCHNFEILAINSNNVILLCLHSASIDIYQVTKSSKLEQGSSFPIFQTINSTLIDTAPFCPTHANVKNPMLNYFEILSNCGNGDAKIISFYYEEAAIYSSQYRLNTSNNEYLLCGTSSEIILMSKIGIHSLHYNYMSFTTMHSHDLSNGQIASLHCGSEGDIVVALYKISDGYFDVVVVNGGNPYQQSKKILQIFRNVSFDISSRIEIVKLADFNIIGLESSTNLKSKYIGFSRENIFIDFTFQNDNTDSGFSGKYQLQAYSNDKLSIILEDIIEVKTFNNNVSNIFPSFMRNAKIGSIPLESIIKKQGPTINIGLLKNSSSIHLSRFEEKLGVLDAILAKVSENYIIALNKKRRMFSVWKDLQSRSLLGSVWFSDSIQNAIDFDYIEEASPMMITLVVLYKFNGFECRLSRIRINANQRGFIFKEEVFRISSDLECYNRIKITHIISEQTTFKLVCLDPISRRLDIYTLGLEIDETAIQNLNSNYSLYNVDAYDITIEGYKTATIYFASSGNIYKVTVAADQMKEPEWIFSADGNIINNIQCTKSGNLCAADALGKDIVGFDCNGNLVWRAKKVKDYLQGSIRSLEITDRFLGYIGYSQERLAARLFIYDLLYSTPNNSSEYECFYSVSLNIEYLNQQDLTLTIMEGQDGALSYISYSNNTQITLSTFNHKLELTFSNGFEEEFREQSMVFEGFDGEKAVITFPSIFLNGKVIGRSFIQLHLFAIIGLLVLVFLCVGGFMILTIVSRNYGKKYDVSFNDNNSHQTVRPNLHNIKTPGSKKYKLQELNHHEEIDLDEIQMSERDLEKPLISTNRRIDIVELRKKRLNIVKSVIIK